jgi:hypothetical protein
MSGSTEMMVKAKMCATFHETSAVIKDGCRVTRIVTRVARQVRGNGVSHRG